MQWIFWLLAILISAGAGYWTYNTDKQRAVPYPWLTASLRGLLVFFTVLLILVPTIIITKNETEKPVVLLLQDNSRSIGVALGNDSTSYRNNMQQLAGRLSDKYKVVKWGFGNTIQNDSLFQYTQSATDISGALSRAQESFGLQNLGAVILASDGRYNQGVNPMYQQISLHSPLYTVALGDSTTQKDVRIAQAYANKTVTLHSQFEIRADVVATLCKNYNNSVTLQEEGSIVSATPINISSDRYDRSVSFTVTAARAGLHHYVITVPVAEGEKNTANNRKDVFVEVVDERKNVLIVSDAPDPDVNAIKEALIGIETYKVTAEVIDNTLPSLKDYNVIILDGLPSHRNNVLPQVLAAKKPVWFILNGQSDIAALNQEQRLTHLNLTQAQPHDVLGGYNEAFNTFILPQNIGEITDKMPPLHVPVTNVTAGPNAGILFYQKSGAGNSETPLWLLQQGNTCVAVLMGEGVWRWRLYEYKNFGRHGVVDECIRQTVSFLSASNNERPFNVTLPKYVWSDQEPIILNAYFLDPNNEQVNTPDAQITIIDSNGRKQTFSFECSGNSYNLNIGVWAGGNYTYSAHTIYNGKEYSANGSFTVQSIPLELMESGADYPLLYGLAKKYNGAFIPAKNVSSLYDSITHNENIKPVIQTNTETVPLVDRKWYFFIILLIATTEWLLRKYWLAQ